MSDLTQARAALAQSDHPCGVLHSAPDLEGEIKEACALAPGHDGAHYGYAPFVDWKVHLRTALAEVDRLTARVADLEHLEASQHKARARDVAGIVGWLRKEAVKKANTSEAAGNTGAGLTASIQYAELWFTADAIERGDWHDGTLPADPGMVPRRAVPIVRGVCLSSYLEDGVTHYCDRGEEGPHEVHGHDVHGDGPWTWTDADVT